MERLDEAVSTAMTPRVRTVDPRLSVRDVSSVMVGERIGSVVVGSEGRGIVTKTDIVDAVSESVDPEETPVSALMSAPLVTVEEDETLQRAVDVISDRDVKRVVVRADGDLVGMLTTTDVREQLAPDLDRIVGMFAED
jgi:CBS domain-containing protein